MEHLDALDAKGKMVVVTLVVVIVSAFVLRRVVFAPATLPGELRASGVVAIENSIYAPAAEARRDSCRAYMAGILTYQSIGDAVPMPVRVRSELPEGVDTKALAAQEDALREELREALQPCGLLLTDAAFARLQSMLSVTPTFTVLSATKVPPMLMQHRFIVQALRAGQDGAFGLRVLAVGYVGTPVEGATPNQKRTPYLLTVASPDAHEPVPHPLLSYAVTLTAHKAIEDALPGAAARAPPPAWWGFGTDDD